MITNTSDIPLGLAVWLVVDDYDYNSDEDYISATGLMKPIKHIALFDRVLPEHRTIDVSDLIPTAFGRTIHDSIEKAWKHNYKSSLKKLGYPQSVIEKIIINPEPSELSDDCIPIYLEQREIKQFGKWKIGGKYDFIAEGIVHDHKSTSAYTWVYGTNDEDYKIQGSLYRWLNPERITADYIRIQFIFTDWQKAQARSNPKYPQQRVEYKDVSLMSLEETEQWINAKLTQIERYKNSPEHEIPECTPEELWMSETTYKYYANPEKTDGRSTKNFTNIHEAEAFKSTKGGKGIVITVPGIPKRCDYCPVISVCTQKDKYL